MDLKNKKWSFSSLKLYEQCPYAFFLKCVKEEDEMPNAFQQVGSLAHSLLEKAYKKELYPFELADAFISRYPFCVTSPFPFRIMEESYYQKTLEYFETFDIDEQYEIIGVEKEVMCEIEGIKFIGYIDLLLKDKTDNGIIIVDHKSKSSFKKGEREEYLKQLYLYSSAIFQEYNLFPKELWFNLFRSQQIIKTTFHEGDYTAAIDWFKAGVEHILATDSWDCGIDSWYCGKLCGMDSCVYRGE